MTIFPQSNGKIYMLNNVEWYPSTMYLSELSQATDGALSMTSTRGVASPLGNAGPFAFLCGGSVTPWGTKLVGEEYTYDARRASPYTSSTVQQLGRGVGWYFNGTQPETGGPYPVADALPNPPNLGNVNLPPNQATANSQFYPYNYGSIVEAKVAADGSVTSKKMFTMGRYVCATCECACLPVHYVRTYLTLDTYIPSAHTPTHAGSTTSWRLPFPTGARSSRATIWATMASLSCS